MNLEIFSKFLVVSVAGGGLIAIPATTFSNSNSQSINLLLKKLSQDQKIFTEVTKQQLKESSCRVLATDSEDNKNQIIVCPVGQNKSSVTFLYSKKDSNQLEKIEKFSNSISTSVARSGGGGWDDAYNLQFQLAQTRSRTTSSTTMKVLKKNHGAFEKFKEVSLANCKLESNKLLCEGQNSRSSNFEITIDLSSSKDFSIS